MFDFLVGRKRQIELRNSETVYSNTSFLFKAIVQVHLDYPQQIQYSIVQNLTNHDHRYLQFSRQRSLVLSKIKGAIRIIIVIAPTMKHIETPQTFLYQTHMRRSTEASPLKKTPPKITKEYCKPANRIPLRSKVKPSTSEIHIQQCTSEEAQSSQPQPRAPSPKNMYISPEHLKKDTTIPTDKLVQRIKMNLSLLEYRMQQLFEQQIEEQTKNESEKRDSCTSRKQDLHNSSSRIRAEMKDGYTGQLTDRKKIEHSRSYKGLMQKGWK